MNTEEKINLIEIIKQFKEKKVLVIGDSMLDEYVYGKAVGLSLETPTLLSEEQKTEITWGGAGNVVKNLLGLGAKVSFITLLGNDSYSFYYTQFKHPSFQIFPIIDPERKTTVKKRFFIEKSGSFYKYFESHILNYSPIREPFEKQILDLFKNQIKNHDFILIIDQKSGNDEMMSRFLIDSIKSIVKENNKPAIACSQISRRESNHRDYAGVDIICMNLNEAKSVYPAFDTSRLSELKEILKSNVCITLGKKGSVLFLNNQEYFAEAIKVEEVDSCGAGDSFLSAFCLSDPFTNPKQAIILGNIWAGLSVKKIGTATPDKQELLEYLNL